MPFISSVLEEITIDAIGRVDYYEGFSIFASFVFNKSLLAPNFVKCCQTPVADHTRHDFDLFFPLPPSRRGLQQQGSPTTPESCPPAG